ncbi:hypothetical protein ACFLMW_003738 [Salmonella enterica]
MKLTKLIIAAAIVASFSSQAAVFHDAAQVTQGRMEAQRYSHVRESHEIGNRTQLGMIADRHAQREEAMSHQARFAGTLESKAAAQAEADARANYGIKGNPNLTSQVHAAEVSQPSTPAATTPAATTPDAPAAVTAAKPNETANSSINVDAASLGNQQVNVTENGVTQTVAASSLPAGTQVSVPMDSAFSRPARTGNGDRSHSNSHSEHGTGNGGSNAQNSRSAGGLADSHVGGGRSGGGFHY